MNLKKYEFKKIILSPIFIGLTLIFLVYNTMMILNKSYMKKDLKVLNEIVSNVGYAITDEMMVNFQKYYKNELNSAKELLNKKDYDLYDTMGKFFDENYLYEGDESKFNKDEIEFLNKILSIEVYYFLSSDLEQDYKRIDINKIAEKELTTSSYNEKINNIIRKNYNEFAIRFKELKENSEHKNLFFYGKTYKMHSLLFKDIFTAIIYEIMILIVLVTAFILNYEFENRTASVIYSTKRGRNLIKDKLMVVLGTTVLITTIIIGIALLIYFNVFDYSELWKIPISNYFGQEYNTHYMSWWNMSILKYLVAVIFVVYILEIIFSGITFILASFIKNTYIVFGTFLLIVGSGILLPVFIPAKFNIVIASVYTPFTLILNPSWWFMMKGMLQTNKYYEIITLLTWSIGILIIGMLCIKKFKRESIK